MNATTRPRMAYRDVLIGILTGIDEHNDPDIEQLLYTFLDELKEANPLTSRWDASSWSPGWPPS